MSMTATTAITKPASARGGNGGPERAPLPAPAANEVVDVFRPSPVQRKSATWPPSDYAASLERDCVSVYALHRREAGCACRIIPKPFRSTSNCAGLSVSHDGGTPDPCAMQHASPGTRRRRDAVNHLQPASAARRDGLRRLGVMQRERSPASTVKHKAARRLMMR